MKQYSMGRNDYVRIANGIMYYVTKELGMDKLTALPFVGNIAEEIRPVIEKIVNEQIEKKNEA